MRLAWELGRFRWEVLAMPADEFFYWQEFFRIHPWTYEREEQNAARLTAFVFNTSLRARQQISVDDLIPHYVKDKPVQFVLKSREQQRAEFGNFKMRLQALKEHRKRKPI